MIRITAYADRLIADLDRLDWPDSIKNMQRNWIGRSTGASVRFASPAGAIEVFTTRPDTLFGATYMVLAPEHPLVDALTTSAWPEGTPPAWTGGHATPGAAVDEYRSAASRRSELERQADAKTKTGVFTGSYATNPANGAEIPVFIADYVLMGYGTGAIMAVPGQDQRDWDFAEAFGLPIVRTVQPPDGLRRPGLRGRRPGHQQRLPRRARDRAGQGADHRLARGARGRRGHRHLQAPGLAVQPPALLGRALPDRLRRGRPAAGGAGVRAPGPAAGDRGLRAGHLRATRTRCPSRRWVAPWTGSRSSWTWATARRSTGAR